MSSWRLVCALGEIPQPGARVVKSNHGPIAVFRTEDNDVFALLDRCPHKGGPLSKGKITGRQVECPVHGWSIAIDDGNAIDPEGEGEGCVRTFPIKIEGDSVFIDD